MMTDDEMFDREEAYMFDQENAWQQMLDEEEEQYLDYLQRKHDIDMYLELRNEKLYDDWILGDS